MLERCAALRGSSTPNVAELACDRGEIRHQRIVRVDDEKRLLGKAATIARQRSAISSSSP